MASLTEQLDALTKQLETVNSEYAQLINACSQKEKEQDQILENIDQLNEQIKLASLTTAIEPETQPTEVEPAPQRTEVELEPSQKATFVMYGEGLLERVLGTSDRYDEEEDEDPKEIILPPLDKKLFPALAALQEKHPIILKRGPSKFKLNMN